jgi:hypothetical protein
VELHLHSNTPSSRGVDLKKAQGQLYFVLTTSQADQTANGNLNFGMQDS